jgi:low affinity Fe/Cu permease
MTFSDIAVATAAAAGRARSFASALGLILLWAITGPIFGFSDTWQLVINTGTTIVTFLMVFLLQHTQNRDTAAIQLKLDAIIKESSVSNFFVGAEQLSEAELQHVRQAFVRMVHEAAADQGALGPGRRDLHPTNDR